MDYLLLPFNVYAQQAQFSTTPDEIVHPALWLGLLFPFVARSNKLVPTLLVYAGLSFAYWALSSQVIRFLLPLSAVAAVMAASVIERFPSLLKTLVKLGLAGMMFLSLLSQIPMLNNIGLKRYFTGDKSPTRVLQSIHPHFRAVFYIEDHLLSTDRVLFLWDGRGYYCAQQCIPDDEQSAAIRLSISSPEPDQLAAELKTMGITHLMLSSPDANWFISYHDPQGWHQTALDYFTQSFLPACSRPIFEEEGFAVFEITCD
jgi:hypothetical protein